MKKVLLILTLLAGIFLVFIYFEFDKESKDYKLMDEMHRLAKDIKSYKTENGQYPSSILEIRDTDKLCINSMFDRCKPVFYKASHDRQDFKLAMKAFSWPILYYHPGMSMTVEEDFQLSDEQRNQIFNQYKTICYMCISLPPGREGLRGNDTSTPTYRETAPIFANPEDWPEL